MQTVSGGLCAAFPAAATVIDMGLSVAESVTQDIRHGESVGTIIADATVSAGFSLLGSAAFTNKTETFIKSGGSLPKKNTAKAMNTAVKRTTKKLAKYLMEDIATNTAMGAMENLSAGFTKWYFQID